MELYNDLLPDPLPAEPMALASAWLATALAARQQPNPDSMVLATATASGQPSARVVLCKEFDVEFGRVSFVTNYDSRKGRELAENARAALVFHWDHSHRQIRVEGVVVKAPEAESDAYFESRNWQRRIGAWASAQSQPLRARAAERGGARGRERFGAPEPTLDNINERQAREHSAAAILGRLLRLGRRGRVVDRRRIAHPRTRALDPIANYCRARAFAPGPGSRRGCSLKPRMWRNIRIAILLLILGIAAYSNWYDRLSTTDWDETLYIGVFPIDDAAMRVTRDYIARLTADRTSQTSSSS